MHTWSKTKLRLLQTSRRQQTHLFATCPRISQIWANYQPTLTKLTNIQNKPEQHIRTLSTANQNKLTIKLLLTIIQIIPYEIWTTINNYKYDNTQISQDIIQTKINTQIRYIIHTHYKYHKINGTLNTFKELFCINNALATIENNTLHIMLKQYSLPTSSIKNIAKLTMRWSIAAIARVRIPQDPNP